MEKMIRTLVNKLAGRKKTLEENIDLEKAYSLIYESSDAKFNVKYDCADINFFISQPYSNVIDFISNNFKGYFPRKVDVRHSIFTGENKNKHYIDILGFRENVSIGSSTTYKRYNSATITYNLKDREPINKTPEIFFYDEFP